METNRLYAPCPHCGRRLRFGAEALGRKARCTSCNQRLAVLNNGRLYEIGSSIARSDSNESTRADEGGVGKTDGFCVRPKGGLSWLESLALIAAAIGTTAVLLQSPVSHPAHAHDTHPAIVQEAATLMTGQAEPVSHEPVGVEEPVEPLFPEKDLLEPGAKDENDGIARPVSGESDANRGLHHRALRREDWMHRGLTHCREGRFEEGLRCFEQTVAFEPNDAEAHDYRGRALFCLGRWAESVMAHDRCLDLAADRSPVRAYRAQALRILQNLDVAAVR